MKPINPNVEKFHEQLVTMRALSLLFYNFTREQIDELKKVREFNHEWSKIEAYVKRKKSFSIPEERFYLLFAHVSYETQSEIIRVAFEKYEVESRTGINEDQSMKKMFASMIEKKGEEK